MRPLFILGVVVVLAVNAFVALIWPPWPPIAWSLVVLGPLIVVGLFDYFQKSHAIRRNFPLIGNLRYLLEAIRPEISQYFIESDTSGVPFSRDQRSVVYQRSKKVRDTVPFGTLRDVYEVGYEWVNHSINPVEVPQDTLRVTIGGPDCRKPYSASILNISAMSFGALSKNAILALSEGARLGNFAHNTGEGGISPYHLEGGADLIWQIGTGYFGCRTPDGRFNPDSFAERAQLDRVRMIELKLSQGAKPGHGGILPGAKVTPEIARIREVPLGKDVISPPGHSAFSTPIELLEFVAHLRELSGGKPVGIKLCVGKRREFIAIGKAMLETGITPDFVAVDGGEGGTGAAPLEFSNHLGTPLTEGLSLVHNVLTGFDLRSKVRVLSSGKVTTGFTMVKRLALGADICYSARAMMLALGCIQALRCNSNHCPTGVATQASSLVAGLVPSDKRVRVANYHQETMESVSEILGAMGIRHPQDLRPWHLLRRTTPTAIQHYGEILTALEPGDFLGKEVPQAYRRSFALASAATFDRNPLSQD